MLHTKFQGNQTNASAEDFLWFLPLYGYGGHLDHVIWTKYINFLAPITWRGMIIIHHSNIGRWSVQLTAMFFVLSFQEPTTTTTAGNLVRTISALCI